MKKVLTTIFMSAGFVLKLAFVGALLIGHFVMNMVGALICAISSGN